MIDAGTLKRILKEDELILLSRAEEVGAVKVIVKVISAIRDSDRSMNESQPKRDDNDLKNDWVFKAGGISRLNDVLSLPQVAANIIKK